MQNARRGKKEKKNACIAEILKAIIQKDYIVLIAQSKDIAENRIR